MSDLQNLFDRSASAVGATVYWTTRAARLMVGVPDYETYVAHRRANHPDQPIMTYVEFFRERQQARYAVGKGRFRPTFTTASFLSMLVSRGIRLALPNGDRRGRL